MTTEEDRRRGEVMLTRAIEASRSALGRSTPNPAVGAVVLSAEGVVVGVGATGVPGCRHAEVVALDEAGERALGGSLYVTLEPCRHTGRTGPCTERILASGIREVIFGVADPGAGTGGGAEVLRAAGVTVHAGVLEQACAQGPLRAWLHRQVTGRPLVTWKYAASLDGRVAAADGSSRWITGSAARAHAHGRRAEVDAILVGTGTLRADDPLLTARHPDGSDRNRHPLACVMGLGDVPTTAAVRRSPGGFRHLRTRDPRGALTLLGDLNHVLVEGGPTVAGAFLAAGVVDDIDAYLSPLVLGEGAPAVRGAGVSTLAGAHDFDVHSVCRLGDDLHLHLTRRSDPGGEHPERNHPSCSPESSKR